MELLVEAAFRGASKGGVSRQSLAAMVAATLRIAALVSKGLLDEEVGPRVDAVAEGLSIHRTPDQ
eukprot:6294584-Prorocentrum_lima.AAC.1